MWGAHAGHRVLGLWFLVGAARTWVAWKAELIIRKEREFSCTEFQRRRAHVISGLRVYCAPTLVDIQSNINKTRIGPRLNSRFPLRNLS